MSKLNTSVSLATGIVLCTWWQATPGGGGVLGPSLGTHCGTLNSGAAGHRKRGMI